MTSFRHEQRISIYSQYPGEHEMRFALFSRFGKGKQTLFPLNTFHQDRLLNALSKASFSFFSVRFLPCGIVIISTLDTHPKMRWYLSDALKGGCHVSGYAVFSAKDSRYCLFGFSRAHGKLTNTHPELFKFFRKNYTRVELHRRNEIFKCCHSRHLP